MSGTFTGTALLVRTHLRCGWRALTAWIAGAAALVVATGVGIAALYPTLADRETYAATAGASPAAAAFNGRGYDLTTLGGITAYEVGFMGLLGLPIVALHLAIRFSRREEDAGRTELVTAGRVGRLAPVAAAGLTLVLTWAAFVVACAVGLTAAGLPAAGSGRYAAGLGLYAACCGAVGLVVAEVSREARTAYGLGLALTLLAFLLRAIVDGRHLEEDLAGPTGWLAQLRPFGDWAGWPLLAYAGSALAAWVLAALVAHRRDLGGGLVPTRPGPAYGVARLGTSTGLAWRFLRPAFLGWALGMGAWSLALGGLSGEMTDIVRANPAMLAAFGVARPEDLLTAMTLLLGAIGAASFGVSAMMRLAREEAAGRLALVLSTRTSRTRLWAGWLFVAALLAATILVVAAGALGLAMAWSTGRWAHLSTGLRAGLALVVPVLVVLAATAVVQGVAPSYTGIGWILVGWVTVVGVLAETLRLPQWARGLSPLYRAGNVPIDDPNGIALVAMGALAVVLVVLGLSRFRTRDLAAG